MMLGVSQSPHRKEEELHTVCVCNVSWYALPYSESGGMFSFRRTGASTAAACLLLSSSYPVNRLGMKRAAKMGRRQMSRARTWTARRRWPGLRAATATTAPPLASALAAAAQLRAAARLAGHPTPRYATHATVQHPSSPEKQRPQSCTDYAHGPGWQGAVYILSTVPIVICVLLKSGNSTKE